MEQLLLHLFGDYILQTNWMAQNKTKNMLPAMIHALVYTIPFICLTQSVVALFIIFYTHAYIDHYRLARYVIFAKNWINDRTLCWKDCSDTGYSKAMPIWLSTWLLIITDNTCHLLINYGSIRWL